MINRDDPYATQPQQQAASPYTTDQIAGFYQKYLGRAASAGEAQGWASQAGAEEGIKNSSEAQAWTAKNAGGGAAAGAAASGGTAAPGTTVTPGYDYNKFQSGWYNAAPGTNLQDFINQHPEYTQGATVSHGGEWLNLPGGQAFDAVGDFGTGGANKPQWGDQQHDYATGRALTPAESIAAEQQWAAANGGGGSGVAASVGGGGSSTSSTSVSATSAQDQALRAQLIAQLTQRAGQSLAIDSKTDPNIRSQVDPYAAQQDRASRNYMADLAEKQGPLANLQGQARVVAEQAGQNTGLFESQAVGRELDARRTEIKDALTSMQGMLTQDQTIALQQQLAQLDDATKRLGLQYQNQQAGAQIGLGQNQLGLQYSQFDWATSPLNPANIRNFNTSA